MADPSMPLAGAALPGDDPDAAEQRAWQAFVTDLAAHLAGRWPAMPERLGERYGAFIDRAVQQALALGITRAAAVARLVHLGFVWGPGFHERPQHAWAAPLLAMAARSDWLALHQLVQRSLTELQQLPGSRITPQALAEADAGLIDRYGALGHHGALRPAEPPPAPRTACDIDAAELRLLDAPWLQQSVLGGTAADGTAPDWQRRSVAWPAPQRLDAAHPLPPQLSALSHPAGQGPQARLQVKLRPLCVCDGDRHPQLDFAGPHGRWTWAGHAGKSASWGLATREQPLPPAGAGALVAEDTSPELHRLDLGSCGLRDSGEPIGAQRCTVAVWPATQWWLQWQRSPAPAQTLLATQGQPRPWQPGATRCRVERDGQAQDASALRQQFEAGLDGATAAGLHALTTAWAVLPGIGAAQVDGALGLLTGQASLTWGWALDANAGLGAAALMRIVGQLAFDAARADLTLTGEWGADADAGDALAGSRTRLQLRLAGQARLQQRLQRESAAAPVAALLGQAIARWRWPVQLQVQPLATPSGRLAQALGPATGALVGEAGLRPCTTGRSGWEWFASLRLEPVAVTLGSQDPLLGWQTQTLPLLPALTLVDWRLG